MIRQKTFAARFIGTVSVASPLLALAALCALFGQSAFVIGCLAGAGVLAGASIVAPRWSALVQDYFARETAVISRGITDSLVAGVYAALIPVGVAMRLYDRLTGSRRVSTYWRKS